MKNRRNLGCAAVVAVVTLLSLGLSGSIAAVAAPLSATSSASTAGSEKVRTWDITGDSNSVGKAHPAHGLSALEVGLASRRAYPVWVGERTVLDQSTSYAVGGRKTWEMLENAKPTTSDLSVIMGGTNDIRHGYTISNSMKNIEKWAAVKDAPRVLVLAIAPHQKLSSKVIAYNKALKKLVAKHASDHWVYSDPWVQMRDSKNAGKWARNCGASDGVHASPGGYYKLGLTVGTRIGKLLGTNYSDVRNPDKVSCLWEPGTTS